MWNIPSFIELISALLGLVGVWLNARPNIWGWPVGVLSVLLAAVVYFQSRLFAEFGLQIFYALSGLYGWWKWQQEKDAIHQLPIYKIPLYTLIISILSGLIFTFILGWFLIEYTPADFPWLDAGLASFSLVAQIWLARKYLENWLLWIIIDSISVGLYAAKGLWFFMVYFLILTFIALRAYRDWQRKPT